MFELKNYQRAKELYREKYKKDLSDKKIKYRFGICLIYTYELEKGIKALEANTSEPSTSVEVWYHLARAYHLSNRYDKAISLYKKYNSITGAKADLILFAKRNIEMCENAKNLIQKPLNIEFENLGINVNSNGIEYLPQVTPDESMLFYSTRRVGNTGRVFDLEGYYTADIYLSKYKYGKWSKARSIGPPNSYGNEQTAGISEDGKTILYYVNNPKSKNNIQISNKSKASFKKSITIDSKEINTTQGKQTSATISNDNNYIIFSSDKPEGLGKKDLYICKKLPNGKWAKPENLGNTINSVYDETYPHLTDNGMTLYFSSNGHNSIGGYDIFVSYFDLAKKEWSKPTNVGYPLNTPYDNIGISFSENKKYAYLATHRNDSYGDLDIYKVNFIDTPPSYTTITGYLLDVDSNVIHSPLKIEAFIKKTNQISGIFKVDPVNGKFVMALPPNDYILKIDIPKKRDIKQPITIQGRNKYKKEITHNITVTFDSSENIQN
jgi:tetratricopeptide (TPR) repeat protein